MVVKDRVPLLARRAQVDVDDETVVLLHFAGKVAHHASEAVDLRRQSHTQRGGQPFYYFAPIRPKVDDPP